MGLQGKQSPIPKLTKLDAWLDHYILTGDELAAVDFAEYECKDAKVRRTIAAQNIKRCSDRILEATRLHIGKLAPKAVSVLSALMQDESQAGSNRITAAKAVASYSGLDVKLTEDLTKHDTRSDKELLSNLTALIQSENMPPELRAAITNATAQNTPDNVTPLKKANE